MLLLGVPSDHALLLHLVLAICVGSDLKDGFCVDGLYIWIKRLPNEEENKADPHVKQGRTSKKAYIHKNSKHIQRLGSPAASLSVPPKRVSHNDDDRHDSIWLQFSGRAAHQIIKYRDLPFNPNMDKNPNFWLISRPVEITYFFLMC